MAPHIIKIAATFDVTIVSSNNNAYLLNDLPSVFIPLEIKRKISLFRDVKILLSLIQLFTNNKFDVVHSITPKAGLLAMFAAYICRVPVRIHTFTGQVWATKKGISRYFLKVMDRLIVFFSTKILVDSPSQLSFIEQENILKPNLGVVLGCGSVCGVNTLKFSPNLEVKLEIRRQLGINPNDLVILFMGRLNTQKGILKLAEAFNSIAGKHKNVHLLIVGQEEDVLFSKIEDICRVNSNKLHYINFTQVPESYMATSDIFCLPSLREGFGQVIIESASAGIPSVASNIYGISDAIENDVTGILFDLSNFNSLVKSLESLICNKDLRESMGSLARQRAINQFDENIITSAFLYFYQKQILSTHSLH